ncbi:endonuclease III [candidate division KSB1 bacterium]|nr:MAG: endonuclease III [candidate division KSB1 bacterium]
MKRMIEILKVEINKYKNPVVTQYAKEKRTPFQILVSTILSLRTKDETTAEVSKRLFKIVNKPEDILKLGEKRLSEIIYPAGFYKNKAKNLIEISRTLLKKHKGKVPDELDELLKLKGVGRKTANLVITLGFNKPGICVDTHVHRITNRWGYVDTKTPEKTEFELRKKLPEKYWIMFNDLLVTYGQNICKPVSPLCSKCKIESFCEKNGVKKSR